MRCQVDIISFGEIEENTPLLEKFMSNVNANDSNLVTVEPGKLLSDVLVSTPIFRQGGGQISEFGGLGQGDADLQAAIRASQGDASGGAAQGGFDGIDPNTDPGTLCSAYSAVHTLQSIPCNMKCVCLWLQNWRWR